MKMALFKLGFLVLLVVGLAACSSSNNLPDPSSSTATQETSCDATQAGCVEGQLVADEVVQGVSFTCTSTDQTVTVTSVTDENGFFTCPSNAVALFYIGSAISSNQVILGTVTITPQTVASTTTSSSTSTSGVVTVTPADLVFGNTTGSNNNVDPVTNQQVVNIVRFLKALDSDGETWQAPGFSGFNGNNRIVISDAVSEQVAKLSTSLQAAEFNHPDLSPALQSFIDSVPGKNHTVDVPPYAVAQQQLRDYLNSSFAGVYLSSGLPCAVANRGTTLGQEVYDQGMCNPQGSGSAPQSGDLVMFVDRTGYGFGFGVTSPNSNITQSALSNFYIDGTTAAGVPDPTLPLYRPFNYINGQLNLTAGSQTSASNPVPVTWTGVLNGGRIASTVNNYYLNYGVSLADGNLSDLGVWTYDAAGTSSGDYVPAGQFFMYNSKPANQYLDDSVYGKLSFPINLQLTFEYQPTSAEPCTATATDNSSYCLLNTSPPTGVTGASKSYGPTGTLQISILQNGNIVTNLNQDCNNLQDPTAATLVDTNGQQEYRLGYVSTVTTGVMPSDTTSTTVNQLSLTLMFPKNTNTNLPPQLQGVLAGISAGALVKLPVSGTNSMNVVLGDGMTWYNYFDLISVIDILADDSSSLGTPPHSYSSGALLIKPATNTDPTTGGTCTGTVPD